MLSFIVLQIGDPIFINYYKIPSGISVLMRAYLILYLNFPVCYRTINSIGVNFEEVLGRRYGDFV